MFFYIKESDPSHFIRNRVKMFPALGDKHVLPISVLNTWYADIIYPTSFSTPTNTPEPYSGFPLKASLIRQVACRTNLTPWHFKDIGGKWNVSGTYRVKEVHILWWQINLRYIVTLVALSFRCVQHDDLLSSIRKSVNEISLVHIYDKAGNKCYIQDNTDTRKYPSVWIDALEE